MKRRQASETTNNDRHVNETCKGPFEHTEDSNLDPHNHSNNTCETSEESSDNIQNSSYHLGAIKENICQGTLDKFNYLPTKMESEVNKASDKDVKDRKRKCNSSNIVDEKINDVFVETCGEKINADDKNDQNESCADATRGQRTGNVSERTYNTRGHRTENTDERTYETRGHKTENTVERTYETRGHKTGNTDDKRKNRKTENFDKGKKQKRTRSKVGTKRSHKKSKIQNEQAKLYNKLKQAAEGSEIAFHESDCETENKLFDKSLTCEREDQQDNTSGSIKSLRTISKDLLASASVVTHNQRSGKSNIETTSNPEDVKNSLKGKEKLDWREQLLLLEMSHNEFDDNTIISENQGSKESDKSIGKETNAQPKSQKGKQMRSNFKYIKGSKSSQALERTKNIKKDTARKAVLSEEGRDRKDLGELVREVRRRKNTKTMLNLHSNNKDTRLNSSDSAISCSGSNLNKDECYANPFEDVRLSLDLSVPCNMSTPQDQSQIRKPYVRRKTCKRKIGMAPSKKSNKRNNCMSDEDRDGAVHDLSSLDLSLPTPKPPKSDHNPFSLSFDAEKDDDDHSSDEDLPVGLTPLKIEKTVSENDIVWVKWKKWPHVPALVQKVYKKKRRVTCAVFLPNGFVEDFTLSSNPGSVIPYCDPKKDEILASAKNMSVEDQIYFRACCAEAEKYFTKEALKGLESTAVCKENITEEDEVENSCEERFSPCKKKRKKSDCVITKIDNHGLSKQGQLRVEKMAKKTKPLTDFLVSDTTKEYLQKIYNGSIQSDLHDKFLSGTIRERAKMKHRGFGPIDDDEQIELLLTTYLRWIKEIKKKNIHEINYVFDVWVPEAVVFAFKKLKGYGQKRAWEKFNKGVKRTKEELQIMHNDMVDVEKTNKLVSDKLTDFVLK